MQADLKAKIYSLSILLGQAPEFVMNEMDIMKPLPAPSDAVPVGLPSDLLRRRPDIKTAEYELKASIADIGTQTAELFPKFFITGNAGTNATLFSDIFSTATQTWGFGALMQWSIFNGGAIRAGIDIEEAETKAALASYEKTVLEALADVETALIRYAKEIETRKLLEQGVASRQKSVNLAKQLFEVGEQDYLAVLDAERELITSEDDLVVSETQSITKLISLYTALGGGWETFQENN